MTQVLLSEVAASVLRWIVFCAGTLLVGVVAFQHVSNAVPAATKSVDGGRRRLVALARGAAVALVGAAAGRMAQQALAFAPAPTEAIGVAASLVATTWGIAWSAQILGGLWLAFRPPLLAVPARLGADHLVVAVVAAAPAFMGHAIGAPSLIVLLVAADIAHLLAAGVWVGTLALVLLVALPGASSATAIALVRGFSPWALAGAATLAATGVFASWLHLQELGFLWSSDYGRRLLLKVFLVATVAAIGAVNWKRMTPKLAQPDGTRRLARAARIELVVAVAVLAVTAVLVATPLPGE
jgi:putative copper export protein